MALLAETADPTGPVEGDRPGRRWRRRWGVAAVVGLAVVSAAGGALAPRLFARGHPASYVGRDASVVAADLGCSGYRQDQSHDQSVYRYRDQGTCLLDGATVTITTFDRASDGDAFLTLMRGLTPVLHPTWAGAAVAAGEGWNVAGTTDLSADVAEAAVRRLGSGGVELMPSATKS
jgi:hypothetical protein